MSCVKVKAEVENLLDWGVSRNRGKIARDMRCISLVSKDKFDRILRECMRSEAIH